MYNGDNLGGRNMKKIGLLIISLCIVLFISACTKENDLHKDELSDYKPMVYVQDQLYGDTGDVSSALPNGAVAIGTIQKVVPQNEPMVDENLISNTLPVGSEVFADELNPHIIYVKISNKSLDQYLAYEAME